MKISSNNQLVDFNKITYIEKSNKSNRNNHLIKLTAATHIENSITGVERKVLNILLKIARDDLLKSRNNNILSERSHSVHVNEINAMLGLDATTNYKYIKDSINSLTNPIRFNILNKDKKQKWDVSISCLSEVYSNGGVIHYSIAPSLINTFVKPSSYAYLDLDIQKHLSSKYTLALWEFCCEQLDSVKSDILTTSFITIKDFRALLGIDSNSYAEFKFLNAKIIKKAAKELNEKSDILVQDILIRKHGKIIEGIAFKIERKNLKNLQLIASLEQDQLELMPQDIIETINNSLDLNETIIKANSIGIDELEFNKYLKKFSLPDIKTAIEYMSKKSNLNDINNIAAYLWTLLEKGITENTFEKTKSIDEEIIKEKYKLTLTNALIKFQSIEGIAKKFFITFAEEYEKLFAFWIGQCIFVSYENGFLILKTSSNVVADYINHNLTSQIREVFSRVDLDYKGFEIKLNKTN